MGHNLEEKNEKISMMYVGKQPWHGLGQYLGENNVTAEEAMQAASMDWEVATVPLYIETETPEYSGIMKAVKDRKAIIRTDTYDVLGLKSDHYRPLQNRDAFKVLDLVVGSNQAVWHTAGVLGKGERIWISAKIPDTFSVGSKDDRIEQYFLLTNGHDGLSSIQIKFTPVRVVCQNTLKQALIADENKVMNIKHMGINMENRLKIAGELLSRLHGYAKIFNDEADKMFNYRMSDFAIDNFLRKVLKVDDDLLDDKKYIGIKHLVENGMGTELEGVKGSLWGTYNAVTEFADHSEHKNQANWILTGEGFKLKERSWHEAIELVNTL